MPAYIPSFQDTDMSINAMIPAQDFHERRSFESSASVDDGSHFPLPTLYPVYPLPPQHSPPQHPPLQLHTLNMQMSTIDPQPETQQLRLHVQQLQLQLVWKDQQIQDLQCRLTYLELQQHAPQLAVPRIGHPLQQQPLPQQLALLSNGLHLTRQPWVTSMFRVFHTDKW